MFIFFIGKHKRNLNTNAHIDNNQTRQQHYLQTQTHYYPANNSNTQNTNTQQYKHKHSPRIHHKMSTSSYLSNYYSKARSKQHSTNALPPCAAMSFVVYPPA